MNGKISNPAQIGYIRRYTLTEGKENGLRVVEVNNGVLRFMLNESKALDMMQLWQENVNISFLSKNAFTAREINFLNRFEGGMIYTCGLDSVGGREGYELHGALHNTPAKIVKCENDGVNLTVVGEVEFTALFGQNLLLRRTFSTKIGSDKFSLSDKIINRGSSEQNYCLLYHINLGYPMLDEGVKINIDADNITPRNEWAGKFIDSMNVFSADKPGDEERCYFIENKNGKAEVINQKLGKKFTLEYSKDTLPCFVQWNTFASGDYALGLEPATTLLDDKFKYSTLAPSEEITFDLSISVKNI